MTDRLSWDEYGLAIANVVAQRAACTRRQVGAVVMDQNKTIISTGYNGTVAGVPNCSDGGCPRGKLTYEEQQAFVGYDNCNGCHAEANALLRAGERARGATIYITCQPCHSCAILIEAAGIARVIFSEVDK